MGDGTSIIDSFSGGIPYHINVCIKAFTIAPNDDELQDTTPKTIEGIAPVEFKADNVTLNAANTTLASSVTLTAQGVSANDSVRVYLANKSRTYKPATISGSDLHSLQAKGLAGPSTWSYMPVYEAGYKPDTFFAEDGINYAAYGPFTVNADESGRLVVDVDALRYANGNAGKVPEGYYTVYVVPEDGAVSEFGVFQLAATNASSNGSTEPETPTPTLNTTPSTDSGSGGGGGGGCNAGIFCASALVLVFLNRKH